MSRAEIWVRFAAAVASAMEGEQTSSEKIAEWAADAADKLLIEYDKRFGSDADQRT